MGAANMRRHGRRQRAANPIPWPGSLAQGTHGGYLEMVRGYPL